MAGLGSQNLSIGLFGVPQPSGMVELNRARKNFLDALGALGVRGVARAALLAVHKQSPHTRRTDLIAPFFPVFPVLY